jgi:predicted O-methyltransferase YrrM
MIRNAIRLIRTRGIAETIHRGRQQLIPNIQRKYRGYQVRGGLPLLITHKLRTGLGLLIPTETALDLSVRALRRRQQTETTLADYLTTVYRYSGFGPFTSIRPMQIPAELRELSEIVARRDPETVVEIGTARGGSFYIWCRYLDAQVVSIDLPENDPRSIGPGPHFFREMDSDTDTEFIRGDSHSEYTKQECTEILDGQDIDFLFIDGDHSYEGVKNDFELYRELMASDGIIALHDIASEWLDIQDFWAELQDDYQTQEIVIPSTEKTSRNKLGIGIVRC